MHILVCSAVEMELYVSLVKMEHLYLRGVLNWVDGIISPLSSDIGSVRIDLFLRPQAAVTVAALDTGKKRNQTFYCNKHNKLLP